MFQILGINVNILGQLQQIARKANLVSLEAKFYAE